MKVMSKMVLIFSKVKNKNTQLIEKALRWKSQVKQMSISLLMLIFIYVWSSYFSKSLINL